MSVTTHHILNACTSAHPYKHISYQRLMMGWGLIITWQFKSRYILTWTSRRQKVAHLHISVPQNIQYSLINRILWGRLPSRSELWEAEAESALLIDSLVTAPVHLHSPFISVSLIFSLLFPFRAYCSHNPICDLFLLSSTLLFSLMHNLSSFLSSLYFPWRQSLSIFPWLLLSLHRSPLLSQNNSSDLSEHFL